MVIPSTAYGLTVLLALVIPGAVYTSVRTAVGGRGPHDGELGNRVLRAILASAALDSAYLLVFGDRIVLPLTNRLADDPRRAGLIGFGLGIALPALLAFVIHGRPTRSQVTVLGRRLPWLKPSTGYQSTPTAWDWSALRRGSTFVRIRLDEGVWVGGWFGGDSFISTYPEPRDMFIEQQHHIDEFGVIGAPVDGSAGLWLTLEPGYLVEWVSPTGRVEVEHGRQGQ